MLASWTPWAGLQPVFWEAERCLNSQEDSVRVAWVSGYLLRSLKWLIRMCGLAFHPISTWIPNLWNQRLMQMLNVSNYLAFHDENSAGNQSSSFHTGWTQLTTARKRERSDLTWIPPWSSWHWSSVFCNNKVISILACDRWMLQYQVSAIIGQNVKKCSPPKQFHLLPSLSKKGPSRLRCRMTKRLGYFRCVVDQWGDQNFHS